MCCVLIVADTPEVDAFREDLVAKPLIRLITEDNVVESEVKILRSRCRIERHRHVLLTVGV